MLNLPIIYLTQTWVHVGNACHKVKRFMVSRERSKSGYGSKWQKTIKYLIHWFRCSYMSIWEGNPRELKQLLKQTVLSTKVPSMSYPLFRVCVHLPYSSYPRLWEASSSCPALLGSGRKASQCHLRAAVSTTTTWDKSVPMFQTSGSCTLVMLSQRSIPVA